MPQFFVPKKMSPGGRLTIEGGDAHHIQNVLRLTKNDWIVLSDGKGGRFQSVITAFGRGSVEVLIQEKLPDLQLAPLTLASAVIKHDRIETVIQKAVELGTGTIIPFISERTIPTFSKNISSKKIERWQRIASASAKQCGLPFLPKIGPVTPFPELVKTAESCDHKLMFYEGERETTLQHYFHHRGTEALGNRGTLILIGPEGGFAPGEAVLARDHGFTTLKLGPLIMRVETAAIAALTLTQHFLGHFR